MNLFSKGTSQTLRYKSTLFNAIESHSCGGINDDGKAPSTTGAVIRFVFADNAQVFNFHVLTQPKHSLAASASQKDSSTMIAVGGRIGGIGGVKQNVIERQSFTLPAIRATDHGDLSEPLELTTCIGSPTHVYRAGGLNSSNTRLTDIGKIDPEIPGNEALFGSLGTDLFNLMGHQDSKSGYFVAGNNGDIAYKVVQRMAFYDESIDTTYNDMITFTQAGSCAGNENRLMTAGGQVFVDSYSSIIQALDLTDGSTAFQTGDLDLGRQQSAGASSQHTMFTHQGAASFQGETNRISRHEIDVNPENAVLHIQLVGTALRQRLAATGGRP